MAKKPQDPAFAGQNPAKSPLQLQQAPQLRSGVTAAQNDSNRRAMGGAMIDPPKPRDGFASWPFWAGMGLTIVWFATVFFSTMSAGASGSIAGLPVTTLALGISGVIAPVAFLWMIIAYLQRASDVKAITEPLRRQLQLVLGTGASAESRVRRFNEALEHQLELLRQAGDGSYEVLQNAVQVLQEEERAINSLAERSGKEIQRVAGIVRDNSEVLEDLLHDNRERFSDLSGKIAGHIATLDDKADQAAGRLGDMVDRLHMLIEQFKAAADQKLSDVAHVSDQIGRQEKNTEESSRRMNETLEAARVSAGELNAVMSKNQDLLDASGLRLLTRMQEVGSQIEQFAALSDTKEARLAQSGRQLSETMTREIAALEALTNRLEAQIIAANQGIGSRTDELESRQTKLAEQAGNLMQNLQSTVVMLDTTALEAFQKYSVVSSDVASQGERVAEQFKTKLAEQASGLMQNLQSTVATMDGAVSETLQKYASVNDGITSQSERMAEQFKIRLAEQASSLMQNLQNTVVALDSSASSALQKYTSVNDGVASQGDRVAEQFRARLAEQASGLMQNLERTIATLDGTVSETLQKYASVNDGVTSQSERIAEQLRTRLAEQAGSLMQNLQSTIATLDGTASETLQKYASVNEGVTGQSERVAEQFRTRLAEQANGLMQNFQSTITTLDGTASAALQKYSSVRDDVTSQSDRVVEQFKSSSTHYDTMAQRLEDISKQVVERVSVIGGTLSDQVERIASGSERAAVASQQASQGVSHSLQQLEVMIERIFATEHHVKDSATGVVASMDQTFTHLADLTGQHVAKLNATHIQMEDVGQKLADRAREAEGTWQSLVESTSHQQSLLQQQLRQKVDEAVALLNENAQAIEAARDSIYQHVEAGLSRGGEMVDVLARMGTVTEAPFNEAVAKVKACVEQGEAQMSHFSASLQKNADDISELNQRLSVQGDSASHKAAETLAGLDAVAARMEAIQHGNMQATQDVLLRLNHVAQQVQNRMCDIGSTAESEQQRLGEAVRQLSMDINGLIHDSQTADQRIRIAASLLSEQASDVRGKLEEQASGIEHALGHLTGQFETMSQQMRDTTDVAQTHLEAIGKRYSEITGMSGSGMEDKIRHLDTVVTGAAERLSGLGETIDSRAQQLGVVQHQIHDSTLILDHSTQQALDRLSVFTHAVVAAKTTSGDTAQEVFARLNDIHEQFNRQIGSVSEGSQTIAHSMREAVASLVEQSVGLAAASQQAEQRIESLAATTSALQQEAQQVRISIEGEATAMQTRLAEILTQIESASVGMERHTVLAFDRTEGMAARFEGISQSAFARMGEAATHIETLADGSIAKVEAVNKSLFDQMASLTFAGEHLAEVDSEIRRSAQESTAYLNRLSSEVGATASFAAEQLRQQISGLKTEAEGLLSRFDALGNGFAHQSLGIFDAADTLEQKMTRLRDTAIAAYEDASNVGQRIISSTLEFKNEVAEAVQTMAATGDGLQQRSEMSIALVHQMAGRFAEATQNLRDQFEAQAGRLEEVASRAQEQLQTFTTDIRGGADQLDGLTQKLSSSGSDVNETLEKTNFLVRNVGGQIDRMKTSAQEVSGGLLQSMADMISTFESELKGMTDNAGQNIEGLNQKARSISEQMKEEAELAAGTILETLNDMRSNVEGSLNLVVSKADEVMSSVKDESSKLSTAMTKEVEDAFVKANQNIGVMQLDFRSSIVGMVEVLVTHLRQIQENGAGVMDSIRNSASMGAEQATQLLADLRTKTEEEVRAMSGSVERALQELRQTSMAMAQNLRGDSEETQREAVEVFAKMRGQVEVEFKTILERAQESAAQLQSNCDLLTKDMRKAVIDAERNAERISEEMRRVVEETQVGSSQMADDILSAAQHAKDVGAQFGTVSNAMRSDSAKITAGVSEVAQSLSTTNTLLQRSQSALYDVAQKSSDALNVFNDSIMHQTRNLTGLQQSFMSTAEQMATADERMTVLKCGFENVLSEIMERLNGGLVTLGQQIVSVRQESQQAAEVVGMSGQEVANQNANITQTAEALATALSQLEMVSRTLGSHMRDSASETEQQARQISALSQQVQQQVATLENAAQAAAHQSVAVSQALDNPLSRFETLNERMDKTLNLTVMVGDKITSQLGGITREMEHALHDLAEGTQRAGGIIKDTTQSFKQARDEAAEEMLNRLRDLTRKNEANLIAQKAHVMVQPQVQPQPSFVQPAPAPQVYAPQPVVQPAVQAPAPNLQNLVQSQPVKPAGVGAKKQDSDLISSLTQIIQQLEETAGANSGSADAKQKKTI